MERREVEEKMSSRNGTQNVFLQTEVYNVKSGTLYIYMYIYIVPSNEHQLTMTFTDPVCFHYPLKLTAEGLIRGLKKIWPSRKWVSINNHGAIHWNVVDSLNCSWNLQDFTIEIIVFENKKVLALDRLPASKFLLGNINIYLNKRILNWILSGYILQVSCTLSKSSRYGWFMTWLYEHYMTK